ncbi:MAG: hypothetical protein CMH52_01305 [Myxococcales bacterium]|nr:hypothetical protein [Myxococcales bacterium]
MCCLACGCLGPSQPSSVTPAIETSEAQPAQVLDTANESKIDTPHSNEVIASLDLRTMQETGRFKDLKIARANPISDPFYKRAKATFEGYELNAILALSPKYKTLDPTRHSLRFVCLDGYKTTFSLDSIRGARGVLATRVQGDTPVPWPVKARGKQKQTAGPYYLVWDAETYDEKRPWPYQLTQIEFISNESVDRRLGTHLKNLDRAGEALFRTYCLACHSVNLQGGQLGPELNVPKNITEYRSHDYLLAFIKKPQDFRAGSVMPPSPLKEDEIKSVIVYLGQLKDAKVCSNASQCSDYMDALHK